MTAEQVQSILRHSTIRLTFDRYEQPFEGYPDALMSALACHSPDPALDLALRDLLALLARTYERVAPIADGPPDPAIAGPCIAAFEEAGQEGKGSAWATKSRLRFSPLPLMAHDDDVPSAP